MQVILANMHDYALFFLCLCCNQLQIVSKVNDAYDSGG